MNSAVDRLTEALRERQAILFVGAGVSMSVGLPSWRTLVERMMEELGLAEDSMEEPGFNYQTLAEYYRLKQGSLGPLRSWMDRTWGVSSEDVRNSPIHQMIVSLDFPIIYTTNYDRNLETAFEVWHKPFVKIANARDLTRPAAGCTQIVKFHGDFDDDTSLVLAETDYFDRLEFESPLDIKFRSDVLGRTVLFIGYSMSDMNIRLLLYRLWRTWRTSGYENDRPPSFVFMHKPNIVQQAVLERWGIVLLTEESEDPEQALCSFLTSLKDRVEASA